MAVDYAGLFERYGLKTPQQIADERAKRQLSLMAQLSDEGKIGYGLGQGLARLFGGPDAEVETAKTLQGLFSDYQGLATQPQDAGLQTEMNAIREQLLKYGPQYGALASEMQQAIAEDALTQEANALKVAQSRFSNQPVAVPEYATDDFGVSVPTGEYKTIEVPHRWVDKEGWVPIDPKYRAGAKMTGTVSVTSGTGQGPELNVLNPNWSEDAGITGGPGKPSIKGQTVPDANLLKQYSIDQQLLDGMKDQYNMEIRAGMPVDSFEDWLAYQFRNR